MDIGFIFTNFNNTEFTENAVSSILDSDAPESPIIIVDNASLPEHKRSLEQLQIRCSTVSIIYNEVNVGYFEGLNVGIEFARKSFQDVQYWFIGNNDLIFSSEIKTSLTKCQRSLDRYPVISPDIITMDGQHQNPHVINGISRFREFMYDLYHLDYKLALFIKKVAQVTKGVTDRKDELKHDVPQEIYQGYGACYVLTPLFFKNFNNLWSPTFLMYEEFFLSKQLEEKGFKVFYEPEIKVQHYWHATTNQLPKKKYWELSRDAHKEYRKYIKFWR